MPIDSKNPDTTILGKDLKVGDCIRSERGSHDTCLIVAITNSDDEYSVRLKKFYDEQPAMECYDINDPINGPYSCHLELDKEYKLINSRDDILHIYKTIEYEILRQAADLIQDRNKLLKIMDNAIDKLNRKLEIQKKSLKK